MNHMERVILYGEMSDENMRAAKDALRRAREQAGSDPTEHHVPRNRHERRKAAALARRRA